MSLPPAIVLGVDSAIGLTVVRELGRHGVPVIAVGKSPRAIGRYSRHAGRFVVRPRDRTLGEWLPDLIRETQAAVLLAISEGDLLALADLPEEMAGCRILTPRAAPLAVVLDKTRTLAAAATVGIDTPPTWQPVAGEDFAARADALPYPAILKWSDPPAIWARLSAAGLAFEKTEFASTPQELLARLARYDALVDWPLVQGWCGGHGFGQMLMMQGGTARLRFQHHRLREFPASGGVSTLCETVPLSLHSEQMAKSEALLATIGWEGPAMVEYRHDPATGRYWLMEINGRFWGSLPLASQAGAEFAWEQYRAAVPQADGPPQPAYRARRARYAIPDTKRLARILRAPQAEVAAGQPAPSRWREALAWGADWLDPRTGYYVWDWSDPRPLAGDLIGIIRRGR
ncbi:carboxylate--amine ligase [Sphingobium sufflavum]|uniref:carboxylate--amine ligase n=1 Tax=Sphingobium sufflavum TaxID=1129547 RepID=UPI001F239F89|nr:carboxylate--amine ligase [Sphingobium sufflavum]MCE7798629.1 carboxylate--amine ligase [Sphingobium sufflavum]